MADPGGDADCIFLDDGFLFMAVNVVKKVLTAIREINADIGVPKYLSEMGAKEEDVQSYAEMALKDIAGINNPRQATLEDMIQLIRNAMGLEPHQEKMERVHVLSR